MPPTEVELEPLRPESAVTLAQFAHDADRNVRAEEYARFLALEGAGGFLLRIDGEAVGAVTALRYFEHAILGPLLFAKDRQADSLAILLVQTTVETLRLDQVRRIECEATAAEQVLLKGLGFEMVRETVVLERMPGKPAVAVKADAMDARHFLDLGALDASAFGYGRKEYLLALHRDFTEGARILEHEGELQGYSLLRRSRRGHHLGPLVTAKADQDTAQRLVADAVARVGDEPLVVLAPAESPLMETLSAHAFVEVGRLARMRLGEAPASHGACEWLMGSRITG